MAAVAACAAVDPQVAPERPKHALGLAFSGGIVTEGDEPDPRVGGPNPMAGIDLDWRHGIIGAQSGLRVHGERRAVRLSWFAEFQVAWFVELGVGFRLGWLAGTPHPTRPAFSSDVVFSAGLPLPLGGGLTLVPQLRPGFRVLRNARGDADLRGLHEFAVTLRWTFGRF